MVIKSANKGKGVSFHFTLNNGKTLSVPWLKYRPDGLFETLTRNTPISVVLIGEQGVVNAVVIEGRTYRNKPNTGARQPAERKRQDVESNRTLRTKPESRTPPSRSLSHLAKARAPYNFIPLNDTVITFPPPPSANQFHADRISGYVDVSVETLTPLLIGDERNEEGTEMVALESDPYVPGSSLRGLVRQMIEITSYGKFVMFDGQRRLYFRGLADTTNLRQEYMRYVQTEQQIGGKKKTAAKSLGGYLIYKPEAREYSIIPAIQSNDRKSYVDQYHHGDLKKAFSDSRRSDGGYEVFTGLVPKKHRSHIIYPPDGNATPIPVPEQDIRDYESDRNRNIPINILKSARRKRWVDEKDHEELVEFDLGVPIFYQIQGGRVFFGHTPYFRVPYQKTIGDHVPQALQSDSLVDAADALFGVANRWSTRLFFEDLQWDSTLEGWQLFDHPVTLKILSAPKPTTFQHYLEQMTEVKSNKFQHWNSENARVRGYKLYWHRRVSQDPHAPFSWVEQSDTAEKPNNVHITLHNVVNVGVRFSGRIRFENLSDAELGALLFVLQLPEDCAVKLGMGKPLGLGSVKLTVHRVMRRDIMRYYTSLLTANSWELGEQDISSTTDTYRDAFERYVLTWLYPSKASEELSVMTLWDEPRMSQLRNILTWRTMTEKQQLQWNRLTRYLEIECQQDCIEPATKHGKTNEYKNRLVLPPIDQVFRDGGG